MRSLLLASMIWASGLLLRPCAALRLAGGTWGWAASSRRTLRLFAGAPSDGKTVSQALQQAAEFSSAAVSSSTGGGVGFKKVAAPSPSSGPVPAVNLKGLKAEVSRAILRTFKKVGKANERLQRAEQEYAAVMALDSPPQERLEACPDPDEFREQLVSLQSALGRLRDLEEALKAIKGEGTSVEDKAKLAPLLQVAAELNVSDEPPPPQERGPKKPKGQPAAPRQPFHKHTSVDGVEIRVGRGASDNDELSCNPQYRDGSDWWLHVAGFPGSHVVIRSSDDDLPRNLPETVRDAAVLAAVNSKAAQAGRVQVSLCRCRDVSKPGGSKPGMVRLSGEVGTVSVDIKAERKRFERLDAQKSGGS